MKQCNNKNIIVIKNILVKNILVGHINYGIVQSKPMKIVILPASLIILIRLCKFKSFYYT